MTISPGIVVMYWLLASFGATALWIGACEISRCVARYTRARRCGMRDQ